ncbi:MAG TPA: hypothetical protein VIO58_12635 [Candidatus Methanoperedens sp.]
MHINARKAIVCFQDAYISISLFHYTFLRLKENQNSIKLIEFKSNEHPSDVPDFQSGRFVTASTLVLMLLKVDGNPTRG